MRRYVYAFAAMALLACHSFTGIGGALDVSVVPTGVRIVNNSAAPAYVLVVESQTAARIDWGPCVSPAHYRGIAAGADTTVPYAGVAGYTPAARDIIVYWWHIVGSRADSIRAVNVPLP